MWYLQLLWLIKISVSNKLQRWEECQGPIRIIGILNVFAYLLSLPEGGDRRSSEIEEELYFEKKRKKKKGCFAIFGEILTMKMGKAGV